MHSYCEVARSYLPAMKFLHL
ncbi:Protein of unknown function [Bacillus mycoides]|nr:Protein of unknown function [Bacillus mycoides]SCM90251.1 Protein of unknown function [Bacillus mycoides]